MEILVAALASSALFLGIGLLTRHRVSSACGCGWAAGECPRESCEGERKERTGAGVATQPLPETMSSGNLRVRSIEERRSVQ
jgi:hypothetical protein